MIHEAKRINERERKEASLRRLAALGEAERLACVLAERLPGLRRVLLFGSILSEDRFAVDSDIDLAIEGGDLLAAMGIIETSTFPVDIISMEGLRPAFKEALLAENKVLYAAS